VPAWIEGATMFYGAEEGKTPEKRCIHDMTEK
jgi:hypothetical protein